MQEHAGAALALPGDIRIAAAVSLAIAAVLATVNVLLGIAAFSAELRTRRHAAPANPLRLAPGNHSDRNRVPDHSRFGVSAATVTIGDRLRRLSRW
jgi:hypothetical protein